MNKMNEINTPFDIVGKTIKRVEQVSESASTVSREIGQDANERSGGASGREFFRLTFDDDTQIEL